jgi:uncharacterized membrane protein
VRPEEESRVKPVLFAILAGLSWGVGEICAKAVLNSGKVGPQTLLAVRMLVAAPLAVAAYILAYYVLKSEPREWWRAETGVLAKMILGGGVAAGFAGVLFFYLGLSAAGGDISRIKPIAFTLAPACAVLLGWLVLGEAMTVRKAIGVAMILAGVIVLTSASHGPAPASIEKGTM